MNLNSKDAVLFVPDGSEEGAALRRTTRLCVAAHQDDIEMMAYHGISACFGSDSEWFCGVVVTDGAGSPRSGIYGNYSDEEMKSVRVREQEKAAMIGEYGAQFLLGYPSSAVKNGQDHEVSEDLAEILKVTSPEVVYTHNLADKHPTHVGVSLKLIDAIRSLPVKERPKQVLGCEVWRSLDWMPDSEKILLDVSAHENVANALVSVFDSQICGGKRYDLAAQGRRLANATYAESHGVDRASAVSIAMDLTPLIRDDSLDVAAFIGEKLQTFAAEVADHIEKMRRKSE